MKQLRRQPRTQTGAAVIEFALIGLLFFILLFGVIEIGRVMFTWNAAAEATRYGARVAAVCNMNDTAIANRMRRIMPNLANANVNVAYLPAGCNKSNCLYVRVSISNLQVTTHIPVVGGVLDVPAFTTTLPRESLESTNSDGEANPVCS
jgi:Flp pilus assembly protein TadG